jgi:hypothetical protein
MRVNWGDDDFITAMDQGNHRVTRWPKRDGLTLRNPLCDLFQHRSNRTPATVNQ